MRRAASFSSDECNNWFVNVCPHCNPTTMAAARRQPRASQPSHEWLWGPFVGGVHDLCPFLGGAHDLPHGLRRDQEWLAAGGNVVNLDDEVAVVRQVLSSTGQNGRFMPTCAFSARLKC
jgi:hypothetical protein